MKTLTKFLTTLGILLAALVVNPATGADFTFDGKDAIVVSGRIEYNDFEKKFLPVMTENIGNVKFVLLTGPGGLMVDALEIGYYIHEAELNTVVAGECDSACSYIWLAGKFRLYTSHAALGFHLPYEPNWSGAFASKQYTLAELPDLVQYLKDMGMNDKGINTIPPGNPYSALYVDTETLKSWGIKTLPYGR